MIASAVLASALLSGCSDSSDSSNNRPTIKVPTEDRAFYIMPPGNYGGVPTTKNSLDQLPLYDALTPLRANVTDTDIEALFLAEDFQPVGETTEEVTGRPGLTILYDSFGVPHIYGETRADLAFGAGWTMARDRALFILVGRGAARVAVADIPGVNAFALINSGQTFVPSAATEQLVTEQKALILEVYGAEEGQQILDDAQAYADGMNAYEAANGISTPVPYNTNDVIAVTAFIGSIFGAAGGNEARNAEYLSTLINNLGDGQAQLAWEDTMLFQDPEAPTTIDQRFDYGPLTGGEVTGTLPIDEGSVVDLDPRQPEPAPIIAGVSNAEDVLVPAADAPPRRLASNFQVVDKAASASDATLGVMGPQLGYYYPEIVYQIHFSGAGIEAQGVGVPGLSMYLLIGRTQDYAWSLTSASHDVYDVFIEVLCEPDGSEPTVDSQHYEFNEECVAFESFNAGRLNGVPLVYPQSVHGNMIGTATSEGRPVALTRKRSTFGRDGLNLGALKAMTEGRASTPELFWESANRFGFTFNWVYQSRENIAFFSSGYLPVRAEGLDRRLPILGTGDYEWQGFLSQEEHPHAIGGPNDRLLNWNNQSAPGFMHSDNSPYGSIHQVQLFDQFPDRVELAGVVGIMNRAATEDVRSPAWPVVSEVLRGSNAPGELASAVVDLMDEWVADDAPQLDADNDGFNDHAGPTIIAALWEPLAREVMRPVFGDSVDALNDIRRLSGNSGSSYMDKDLRTLLGKNVEGPFNLQYCGAGDLPTCRDSLWAVVDRVATELAAEYGSEDPSTWLKEGRLLSFNPGLIPNTFRGTSRPTFQQVLEFAPERPEG